MTKVKIYTDGACSGNPGPGGWGAVLIYGNNIKEISGFEDNTTNNRMELKAVIFALSSLKRECDVEVYTDSNYVKEGMSNWIHNWKRNNWRNSNNKEVKNADLWLELDKITSTHKVTWHWVKAHNGDEYNERADYLAVNAIKSTRVF